MTHPLILPMLMQMSIPIVILYILAFRRVSAVKKAGGVAGLRKVGGFTESVKNMGDSLKNQFEMPVLFYALCLAFIAVGETTQCLIIAAWVFVVFRVLHALVHCTKNTIFPTRFFVFFVSGIALTVMLVCAFCQALAHGAG